MRVLVIEDEPGVAGFVRKGLREASYAVDLSDNGTDPDPNFDYDPQRRHGIYYIGNLYDSYKPETLIEAMRALAYTTQAHQDHCQHHVDADIAVGPGLVLHHRGLLVALGQSRGQQAGQRIDRAAGRKGRDDGERLGGQLLLRSGILGQGALACGCCQQGGSAEQGGGFHGELRGTRQGRYKQKKCLRAIDCFLYKTTFFL